MSKPGGILALDLGRRTGWAYGLVGDVPESGTVLLADDELPIDIAFGNLIAWLDTRMTEWHPSVIAREKPMHLQGFAHSKNGQTAVEAAFGFAAIVRGMARRFSVADKPAHYDTVRKHFIGKARTGTRQETKALVVQRCHLLGYMPRNSTSDDRADALANWDYAAATIPAELRLFGEQASA